MNRTAIASELVKLAKELAAEADGTKSIKEVLESASRQEKFFLLFLIKHVKENGKEPLEDTVANIASGSVLPSSVVMMFVRKYPDFIKHEKSDYTPARGSPDVSFGKYGPGGTSRVVPAYLKIDAFGLLRYLKSH